MEETAQMIIRAKYSGALSEMSTYSNLAIQAAAVIFGGIVLWRASAMMHKKKVKGRSRNPFFETPYSRNWKRKG